MQLITQQPAVHIVTANQALVDELLELNTHNRKFKPAHIEALRRDIDDGRFMLTNQGIGVTKSGFLSDGQNRLMAIRDSGYPAVSFVLVTGLEDAAQVAVDRHSRRTQVDVLKLMLNRTVSNQVVAAVNVILKMKRGDNGFYVKKGRTSESEIAEFIQDNHPLLERVMVAAGALRAPMTAALIEYASRFDLGASCALAEQIRLGLGLTSTMPAYRMRQWLERNRSNGGGPAMQTECYCAAISVCVADARGEPMSMVKQSSSWDNLPRRKPNNRPLVNSRIASESARPTP